MQHKLFCWSSNVLTGNFFLLILFMITTHANNKCNYYFWTFEFLKYIFQNWMERVLYKLPIWCANMIAYIKQKTKLVCMEKFEELNLNWKFEDENTSCRLIFFFAQILCTFSYRNFFIYLWLTDFDQKITVQLYMKTLVTLFFLASTLIRACLVREFF